MGHLKGTWYAVDCNGDKTRLAGEIEGDANDGLDVWRSEVKVAARFVELLGMTPGKLADVLLESEQALDRLILAFGPGSVELATFAEHGLFHLLSDYGTYLAEVLSDLLDLTGSAVEEFEIRGERTAGTLRELGFLAKAGSNKVIDVYLLRELSMPVNTPVALFQSIRIPRDFIME